MSSPWVLWAIVAAYVVFVFSKGVAKVRKIHDADDFLLAGRNVGWFFLACTMGATVIGGGASIGAIARTYEWGLLMVLVSSGWYIHFIFAGLVVAPHFRRARLYTVAGYFGHRFGEGPRFFVMLLSLLFSVFIVAAQMAAFGSVLSAILPQFAEVASVLRLAILVGGTLVIIYSTAGGLLAVIHTDMYQFMILLAGFVITLLFCVPDLNRAYDRETRHFVPLPEAVVAAAPSAPTPGADADAAVAPTPESAAPVALPRDFFHPHGGKGWVFLVTTFLAFLLGEAFAPGYATRYCVGKNIKETRWGIAGVGVFLALSFPVVLLAIALYARVHFPDIDPQQALPMVVRQLNHPVVGGLMIGALLMALMSSADSALNSATAIFVKDLFEHQFGWRDDGDGRLLKLARLCSAGLGGAAVLVALLWSDIIGLLLFTYHVWAPAIIVPVCVGALSRHRSPRQTRIVLVTMVTATLGTLAYRGLMGPFADWGRSGLGERLHALLEPFDPAVFGVLLSLLVFGALSAGARLWRGSAAGSATPSNH